MQCLIALVAYYIVCTLMYHIVCAAAAYHNQLWAQAAQLSAPVAKNSCRRTKLQESEILHKKSLNFLTGEILRQYYEK